MALSSVERGRYFNLKRNTDNNGNFSSFAINDYESKEARELEKSLEPFKAAMKDWLNDAIDHFNKLTTDEVAITLGEVPELVSEEDLASILESYPTIRELYEQNNSILVEVQAVENIMDHIEVSFQNPPTALYGYLADRLVGYGVLSCEDFMQAIKDSSPDYTTIGIGFPDISFNSIEEAYAFIKEEGIITELVVDDF